MNTAHKYLKRTLVAALSAGLLLAAAPASAHCDGRDGPVVAAAQQALDSGDVNRVLIWVQPSDEADIRQAFRKARAVRQLNPTAKEMADDYFFETLVRVHRAGEGASYTGLKSAGRDLGPAVPAGDKALQTGSVEPVLDLLTHQLRESIETQFRDVMEKKNFKPGDVAAGQQYVKSYVEYIHAVERIHEAAGTAPHGQGGEAPASHGH